jgi:hypothetical protein
LWQLASTALGIEVSRTHTKMNTEETLNKKWETFIVTQLSELLTLHRVKFDLTRNVVHEVVAHDNARKCLKKHRRFYGQGVDYDKWSDDE